MREGNLARADGRMELPKIDGDSCGRIGFGMWRLGAELWTWQVRGMVDITGRPRVEIGRMCVPT